MLKFYLEIRKKYALLAFNIQNGTCTFTRSICYIRYAKYPEGKVKFPPIERLTVELPSLNYSLVGHFSIVQLSGCRDCIIELSLNKVHKDFKRSLPAEQNPKYGVKVILMMQVQVKSGRTDVTIKFSSEKF